MRIAFVIVAVSYLGVIIPLRLWRARAERRPAKAFDDIVEALGLPFLFLPVFVPLPPVAEKLSFGAGLAIAIVALWRLFRAGARGNPRV